MNTSDLCSAVKNVLVRDSPLIEWCREHYGTEPTIVVGMNDGDPPTEADYPLVIILGVERTRGAPAREDIFNISIGVGVLDPEVTAKEYDSGVRERVHVGLLRAEELREHVEAALYAAQILPTETKSATASENFYPLFLGYLEVVFRTLKTQREPIT